MTDLAGKTSIVVPVRNEEGNVLDLLESFEKLSLKPREVIIVDGGSRDNTISCIKEYLKSHDTLPYKLRLIEFKDAFPGKARNVGIESTSAKIIACTDAGSVADKDWLKRLVVPFKENARLEVVIGNCLPNAKSPFEECAFSINIKGLDRTKFTYFGAVSIAFLKEVWQKVGRYPEEIYPNEDKCFLAKLKKYGAVFSLADKAIVRWRPRTNLCEFAAQYFSYGRADARFGFSSLPHIIRIATYGLGIAFIIWGFTYRLLWLVCAAGLLCYLSAFTFNMYMKLKKQCVFLYIPPLLLMKDIAQVCGYILGVTEKILIPKYRKIAGDKFTIGNE